MCAKCLKPHQRIHGTAYVQCCSKAYWLEAEPLPRDRWYGARKLWVCGYTRRGRPSATMTANWCRYES